MLDWVLNTPLVFIYGGNIDRICVMWFIFHEDLLLEVLKCFSLWLGCRYLNV